VKNSDPILKNRLIARRGTGNAANKLRGDSMHRRSEGVILLTLATIAAVFGVMAQTYAASSNNTALSDSTVPYALDILGTESNSTCRPPPQPQTTNQTIPAHLSPPWMANLTDQQKQTLDDTVKTMKASGATQEQIMNAVNELLKQWGINIPQNTGNKPPPQIMKNSTGGNPPPQQPRMSNATDTARPPQPWMTNQTDTQHPSSPWMANLTAQQKQTLDDTVKTMKASGATQEQIMNAVNELLKQWGINISQCP